MKEAIFLILLLVVVFGISILYRLGIIIELIQEDENDEFD